MEEYENYEAEAEKIREHNEQLLEESQQWLIDKKLSVKTVNKHTDNIDFISICSYSITNHGKQKKEYRLLVIF